MKESHPAAAATALSGASAEQAALARFLQCLAAFLDAAVAALNSEAHAASCYLPLFQQRLRLVMHLLAEDFYSISADRSSVLASGVLVSLLRLALSPRVMESLNDVSRVAWTVFSFLLASVWCGHGGQLDRDDAQHLHALNPILCGAVQRNLAAVAAGPTWRPLLPLPPADMLARLARYVPPPLDMGSLVLNQLLDAKDRAGAWYPARIVRGPEKRPGGSVEVFVTFSGWSEGNNGQTASSMPHVCALLQVDCLSS
jgi:hypothetical protein